jgi:hypothetical protein
MSGDVFTHQHSRAKTPSRLNVFFMTVLSWKAKYTASQELSDIMDERLQAEAGKCAKEQADQELCNVGADPAASCPCVWTQVHTTTGVKPAARVRVQGGVKKAAFTSFSAATETG